MNLSVVVSDAAAAADESAFASFDVPVWVWVGFVSLVVGLLLIDLLLIHRTPHAVSMKAAAVETLAWTLLGVAFAGVMFLWQGGQATSEYMTGFLIEQSLSIDNVFVWALIMSYFSVPREYQFRVLFWGILGALVLRFLFIFGGVALLDRFEWMLFVFGALLLVTALRLLRHSDEEVHPDRNPVLRVVRRIVPSTSEFDGQKLFTRRNGKLLATPLFAVLIVVETTDVVFAVDSIPAILAVSREPFIVFASNAFAIMGLRALYFLLAGMRERFVYLQPALALLMVYVGGKMILSYWYHVPTLVSLLVILTVLTVAVLASLWRGSPEVAGGGGVGAGSDAGADVSTAGQRPAGSVSAHDDTSSGVGRGRQDGGDGLPDGGG